MSNSDISRKIEIMKNLLKAIHKGENVEELKKKFGNVIAQISPFEIPLIEQHLVAEGVSVEEILRLCDLHVELFRDYLAGKELSNVPKGHPVDLFVKENEWILKQSEALGFYSSMLLKAQSIEEASRYLQGLLNVFNSLRALRSHYRKVQMLLFPYLERRGIIAIPRVLWGREDQVVVKLRKLSEEIKKALELRGLEDIRRVGELGIDIAKDVGELVFRENKILFPAVWTLFSEGEWSAIAKIADEIGWIVDVKDREWSPREKPVLPYELKVSIELQQLENLPPEFKDIALRGGLNPDTYEIKEEGDVDLETGYLNVEEVKELIRSLPIEVTYADKNDRVTFYSESKLMKGFVRTKTILGRRLEFCHPPRLEKFVRSVVDELKTGKAEYKEYWTKISDRIVRVLIVAVRNDKGEYLGALEIVEDLTDIINNVEEIKKKIMVL
ncbi:MAG: DUF438 domain-containing protein [Desulfurococcaceae archaeon]